MSNDYRLLLSQKIRDRFYNLKNLKTILADACLMLLCESPGKYEHLNPVLANVTILYPLKTPQTQRFSDVFRRDKMEIFAKNGLTSL